MRSFLFIAVLLFPAPEQEKNSSGLAALTKTPTVTFEQLLAEPEEYMGLRVKFSAVVSEERAVGNPYFTRFTSSQFARFAIHSAARPLWTPEILNQEFAQVFVLKNAPELEQLRSAKRNQLAELTVIVRDSFRNLPWMEVVEVKLSPAWTPEGSLIAYARAQKLRKDGQLPMAIEELHNAYIDPLPKESKIELLREIAALYVETEDPKKAKSTLDKILALEPASAQPQK